MANRIHFAFMGAGHFYGHLTEESQPAQALRQAMLTLREAHPHLRNQHGAHYTAVFAKLCKARIKDLLEAPEAPRAPPATPSPPRANGTPIDKSVLAIGAPKRIRDRDHL